MNSPVSLNTSITRHILGHFLHSYVKITMQLWFIGGKKWNIEETERYEWTKWDLMMKIKKSISAIYHSRVICCIIFVCRHAGYIFQHLSVHSIFYHDATCFGFFEDILLVFVDVFLNYIRLFSYYLTYPHKLDSYAWNTQYNKAKIKFRSVYPTKKSSLTTHNS